MEFLSSRVRRHLNRKLQLGLLYDHTGWATTGSVPLSNGPGLPTHKQSSATPLLDLILLGRG